MTTRRICSVVAAAAVFVLAAAPAPSAFACGWPETCDFQLPSVDSGGGSNGNGGSVTATCSGAAGVATSVNSATYAFDAAATATTTNPAVVPTGVGVVCKVIDAASGTVYGTARGGLPLMTAHAVGTASIPNGRAIRVCVEANAVFSDGSTARFSRC